MFRNYHDLHDALYSEVYCPDCARKRRKGMQGRFPLISGRDGRTLIQGDEAIQDSMCEACGLLEEV
jgi:hypothetical protein